MEEKFLKVVNEALELQENEAKLTDEFRNYGSWNSLTELTLIASLDENFEVGIENEDLAKLNTLADLMKEVIKRSNK